MGWTFFFMFVVLKIPICAAGYLLWYSSRAPEEDVEERGSGDGGGGPHGPRPRRPRPPRRGPHPGSVPAAPARVRVHVRARRLVRPHR